MSAIALKIYVIVCQNKAFFILGYTFLTLHLLQRIFTRVVVGHKARRPHWGACSLRSHSLTHTFFFQTQATGLLLPLASIHSKITFKTAKLNDFATTSLASSQTLLT